MAELREELSEAIEYEKDDKIEELIDKGLDVNEPNQDGVTPLFEAVRKQDDTIVQLLINEMPLDL